MALEGYEMKQEIKDISKYQAVKLSYLGMILLLLLAFVVQVYYHYALTLIKISIIAIPLPIIIEAVIQKKEQKQKHILKTVIRKYRYSYSKYKSYQYSIYFLYVLLIICQVNYIKSKMDNYIIFIYPSMIMSITVMILLVTYFYYRVRIPYCIKYNKY